MQVALDRLIKATSSLAEITNFHWGDDLEIRKDFLKQTGTLIYIIFQLIEIQENNKNVDSATLKDALPEIEQKLSVVYSRSVLIVNSLTMA